MVNVIIVVREPGGSPTDYSLDFELPEVPTVGSYLSIRRIDSREPFGEDMIVRHVWWRLLHTETHGFSSGVAKPGSLVEIFVECDPALSPYSSEQWRASLEGARQRGVQVEDFQVARRRPV